MTSLNSCSCRASTSIVNSCYRPTERLRRPRRHLAALVTTLGSALLVGACSTLSPGQQANPVISSAITQVAPVSPVDRTIANDLVKVAVQIFTPLNTTLQFNTSDNDPLMQHFVSIFSSAGFGIQRVTADQGSNFFSYDRSEEITSTGSSLVSFNSSIGAVEMSRDYIIPSANRVSPASPFRLSGTRVPVTVNDTQSGRMLVANADFSRATYVASLNLNEQAPPVISLITSDLVDRVASANTPESRYQALNSNRVQINNLFYSDQSNFTSILDDYEQVERHVVVFGNDSLVLGNTNKLLIEQLVNNTLGTKDIVSLVGCSNGPTALEIGNEGLAMGRAERVTEALLSQGVPRERILDEGCWAPVSAGNKFPSRGVVLEVWRRAS